MSRRRRRRGRDPGRAHGAHRPEAPAQQHLSAQARPAAPPGAQRFDWAGLQRAGLGGLGLSPAVFWALTPRELLLMLGLDGGAAPLSRARLEELAARFPDAVKERRENGTDRGTGGADRGAGGEPGHDRGDGDEL
ncbi:hypothetical protein C2I36_16015 [Rhodobacteraceae bacterium WD3A24]|nr:hypothetical protein C2I36_16015 [Rhodobacteraceae bacterium WD3A24]